MALREFFSEETGNLSSTRLMSFVCLLASIGLTFYGLAKDANVYEFVITYLVAAFTPKVVQKFAESKPPVMNGKNGRGGIPVPTQQTQPERKAHHGPPYKKPYPQQTTKPNPQVSGGSNASSVQRSGQQ